MSEVHSLKDKNGQYKPIITVKEARKILGKNISDLLSDEEVSRLIGRMSEITNRLLSMKSVPQNDMVI